MPEVETALAHTLYGEPADVTVRATGLDGLQVAQVPFTTSYIPYNDVDAKHCVVDGCNGWRISGHDVCAGHRNAQLKAERDATPVIAAEDE